MFDKTLTLTWIRMTRNGKNHAFVYVKQLRKRAVLYHEKVFPQRNQTSTNLVEQALSSGFWPSKVTNQITDELVFVEILHIDKFIQEQISTYISFYCNVAQKTTVNRLR